MPLLPITEAELNHTAETVFFNIETGQRVYDWWDSAEDTEDNPLWGAATAVRWNLPNPYAWEWAVWRCETNGYVVLNHSPEVEEKVRTLRERLLTPGVDWDGPIQQCIGEIGAQERLRMQRAVAEGYSFTTEGAVRRIDYFFRRT